MRRLLQFSFLFVFNGTMLIPAGGAASGIYFLLPPLGIHFLIMKRKGNYQHEAPSWNSVLYFFSDEKANSNMRHRLFECRFLSVFNSKSQFQQEAPQTHIHG